MGMLMAPLDCDWTMGTDRAPIAPKSENMKSRKQHVLFIKFSFNEVAII
jgi:hypothetical protein